jgi:hypothetical protein
VGLGAATKLKIEHAARALAAEFEAVPCAVIAAEVEATAIRLLEHARFDDYIPILAHRYVRERLRSDGLDPGFAEAA